tara:strand:- start:83 stop:625 length:543 start_codon:yes stop_codon:yes gene_type:complete
MAITINGNGTITGVSTGGLPDGIVDSDMLANTVTTGKILQIVGSVQTSNISYNDTTTYADTGLTCNITTSSSNHAGVFAMVAGDLGGIGSTSGGETVSQMNLVRGSTELIYAHQGGWAGNVSGDRTEDFSNVAMNYYDTGTSASTTYTYKVQFRKVSDTVNATWNKYNGRSTIYLIEVAS